MARTWVRDLPELPEEGDVKNALAAVRSIENRTPSSSGSVYMELLVFEAIRERLKGLLQAIEARDRSEATRLVQEFETASRES